MQIEHLKDLDFRDYLQRALDERQERNARYSLRAYARDLGMSSQKLSQILKGKIGLSSHAAHDVADRLKLQEKEREIFLCLVQYHHGRTSKNKVDAEKKLKRLFTAMAFKDMPVTRLSPFLRWEYVSVYMMSERPDFKADPNEIAQRLGLSEAEANNVLKVLIGEGLIRQDLNGKWYPEDATIHLRIKNSFEEVRRYYRDLLYKAIVSLENQSTEERYNSAAICNMSKSDLEYAKKEIDAFRQKLVRDLSLRGSKDQKVYCLSVQLFQLENPV